MISKTLAGLGLALLALAPLASGAQESVQDPAAELEALIERYQEARAEFMKAYRAAETPEDREAALAKRPRSEDYVGKCLELAQATPGSPTAATGFLWVLRLADRSTAPGVMQTAIEGLIRDHIDSEEARELPAMLSGLGRVIGEDKARGFLQQIVDQAPPGPVLAGALFYQAQGLLEGPEADAESKQQARALLARLVAEFSDVEGPRGRSYGAMAEAWIFDLERLQVGMVVPEIEAADLQGVTFKLSDYRGKVVLLDFWGNW